MVTIEQVRAAKSKLEALLPETPSMGVGIGRGDGEPVLRVFVQASKVPNGLPNQVDGVTVIYSVIGRVEAQ